MGSDSSDSDPNIPLERGVPFSKNQIVWAKWNDKLWYPCLVIDRRDNWMDLAPDREYHNFVIWLGDGRITQMHEKNLRDFCEGFCECFPKMKSDDKYQKPAKILVLLAAAKAGVQIPPDDGQLWQWAAENLPQYSELTVSESFFNLLEEPKVLPPVSRRGARKTVNRGQPLTENRPEPSREKESPRKREWFRLGNPDIFRSGQLVWVFKEAKTYQEGSESQANAGALGHWWPGIVILDDNLNSISVNSDNLVRVGIVGSKIELQVFPRSLVDFSSKYSERYSATLEESSGEYKKSLKSTTNALIFATSNGDKNFIDRHSFINEKLKDYPRIILNKELVAKLLAGVVDFGSSEFKPSQTDTDISEPPAKKPKAKKSVRNNSSVVCAEPSGKPVGSSRAPSHPPSDHPDGSSVSGASVISESSTNKRKKTPPANIDAFVKPLEKGWIRVVMIIRNEGSTRFEVLYHTPDCSKKLRSLEDTKKYFDSNSHVDFCSGLDPVTDFTFDSEVRTGHRLERVKIQKKDVPIVKIEPLHF